MAVVGTDVCTVWPCSVCALQQLMQRSPKGLLSILKLLCRGDAACTPAEGRAAMAAVETSHVRPHCARKPINFSS